MDEVKETLAKLITQLNNQFGEDSAVVHLAKSLDYVIEEQLAQAE